jgi:hypothetical protein
VKTTAIYEGEAINVYAVDLCHYGDRGDYEVFPDRELRLDVTRYADDLAAAGYRVEYVDAEVSIFRDNADTEFTMYPDGRLILENLRPGSIEQAFDVAALIMGFERK